MSDICKHCNEKGLITDCKEGNIACKYCGTVSVDTIIDESPEWRNFAKDSSGQGGDNTNRVDEVNNYLLNDQGICTIISGQNSKGSLARHNMRIIQSNTDKILSAMFQAIINTSNSLNLPDIVAEEAKIVFKVINEKKILKKINKSAVTGACIFLACRKTNNSRSIKEISLELGVDKKKILKYYSMIKKKIIIGCNNKSSSDYASRIAEELGMDREQVRFSKMIAGQASQLGIETGKSPLTVASAAVYLIAEVSGDYKTFSEISDISMIKDMTIKKCFKELRNKEMQLLGDGLPTSWRRENLYRGKSI